MMNFRPKNHWDDHVLPGERKITLITMGGRGGGRKLKRKKKKKQNKTKERKEKEGTIR
jgi:hypothetical protein